MTTTTRKLAAATALMLCYGGSAIAQDTELTILDWTGFDLPALMTAYVEKHGQGPTFSYFADDDEAFQKVSSGFRVDIAHPCSQMVRKYRAAGLIEPWDTSRIPEFSNIYPYMPEGSDISDAEGVWYIPSNFGFTGLAYNAEKVPASDLETLQSLLKPEYTGRVSLPSSPDDLWSLAFLATGVTDASHLTDAQFEAAAAWLRAVHPQVRAYWSDPADLTQMMASGEILLAWSWAEIVPAMRSEGYDIGFQRNAKEGAASWFCGYVNMKDAPGSEDKAYDFINAYLAPSSAKTMVDSFNSGHANAAAMAALDQKIVSDAYLTPTTGPLLVQLPTDPAMKDKMLETKESILAGF